MSDLILLATKKGTLLIDRKQGRWVLRPIAQPGQAVSYAVCVPRDGSLMACMDNAHWGPTLMRARDGEASWAHR